MPVSHFVQVERVRCIEWPVCTTPVVAASCCNGSFEKEKSRLNADRIHLVEMKSQCMRPKFVEALKIMTSFYNCLISIMTSSSLI